MPLVTQKRSRISGLPQLVVVVALHMNRSTAQIAALDETSHPARRVPELVVMAGGCLEAALFREGNQSLRLLPGHGEWLLYIDVASPLQAELGKLKMASRRRRNVDNIRPGSAQKICYITKPLLDQEPFI